MWYRFEEGKSTGTPRITSYQVDYYDFEKFNGDCIDEILFPPEQIGLAITYVGTIEDEGSLGRYIVFANFDDGEQYELKLERIEKGRRCGNFYD